MEFPSFLAHGNSTYGNSTDHHLPDALKYSILAVCVLSGIGSILIIISWILFKTIRSRSRHILVCLSVADLGVALSNGTGLLGSHSENICQWQAAAATFFGSGSLLWTIALAFYLYAAVVLEWQVMKNIRVMVAFYLFCWGIPLIVTCTLIGLKLLGGQPSSETGWQGWWCILKPDITKTQSVVFIFLASELWAYIAYIFVPILYLRTRYHIQKETQAGEQFVTTGSMLAVQSVDRKLMLLPLIFILLHVWSSIMTIRQMYYMFSDDADRHADRHKAWFQALHFLQGIGDSAQGFWNGLLFVMFTKKVRQNYLNLLQGRYGRSADVPVYDKQHPGIAASVVHAGSFAETPSPPPTGSNDSGIGDAHSVNTSDNETTPLFPARRNGRRK